LSLSRFPGLACFDYESRGDVVKVIRMESSGGECHTHDAAAHP